mmetsp:Transcript_13797/g.19660  ORF Transcript_13797/g.19660 Transcript_13797/m.19660 type:complete len:147 (+) Transcript_13797:86-526(+)
MSRNGVFQLTNLVLKYSHRGASSEGVRTFMNAGLIAFAEKNPHIQITAEPISSFEHPSVSGIYRTGLKTTHCLRSYDEKLCLRAFEDLKSQMGTQEYATQNRWASPRSFKRSIQGKWDSSLYHDDRLWVEGISVDSTGSKNKDVEE